MVCGVNMYENRLSVVHFTLGLTAAAEAAELALRGKSPLIFHCGFRRIRARPIFSEDNRRCEIIVSSIFAPAACFFN